MRSSDILIVDDEIGIRELLSEILQDEGYGVAVAENAEAARALRLQTRPAMVLLDIWMPDCDGITLLKEWAKSGLLTMPVVMMSGHANIDTAVEATKIGALDFLEKPITLQKLLSTVDRALKYGQMQTASKMSLDKLGNCAVIKDMLAQAARAAKTASPVLLLGENGSPFELVARYFHKINTAWTEPALPAQIIDDAVGLLKKAGGGVLYLGDIDRYEPMIQRGINILLTRAPRHQVRVVFACSRPIQDLLRDSNQDIDLLHSLSVLTVSIPPLRTQLDDMVFLVDQLMLELSETQKIPPVKFTSAALNALRQYDWPGNLEQLKNVVKSLALNSDKQEVDADEVLAMLDQFTSPAIPNDTGFNFNLPLRELREELERRYFEYHIAQAGGNMSKVAKKVGLERTHLYRKLKQLGIQVAAKKQGEKAE
ncbi:sigma-54-dependent transcriptional regulator [Stenoxybacter acetivorans]|uniref:sigma-54-dependent transcriptional regulator n=1 Tax=Stenoxybacter acetivorans TaxID=422441 RepID=UPI0005657B20|nr:sigma-54 dependent transcriptional regulator [Stenoxybacter acetivorans]